MKNRDEFIEAAQAAARMVQYASGITPADVVTLAMPVLVSDFKEAWEAENDSQLGNATLVKDDIVAAPEPGDRTEAGLRQVLQTLSLILEPADITLL